MYIITGKQAVAGKVPHIILPKQAMYNLLMASIIAVFCTACEKTDSGLYGTWELAQSNYSVTAGSDFTFSDLFGSSWKGTVMLDGTATSFSGEKSITVEVYLTLPQTERKQGEQWIVERGSHYMWFTNFRLRSSGKMYTDYLGIVNK